MPGTAPCLSHAYGHPQRDGLESQPLQALGEWDEEHPPRPSPQPARHAGALALPLAFPAKNNELQTPAITSLCPQPA